MDEKGMALVSWDKVCLTKTHGGLGILDLKVQNVGLLLKFLHKFYNRMDIPWVQLVWDTYYVDSIPHATNVCGSFWWRDLVHLMPIYRGITHIQIKKGTYALFWKDN